MEFIALVFIVIGLIFLIGLATVVLKMYRKVQQGTALVRTGVGGTKVSFSGMLVAPIIHHDEIMDISLKRIEIYRHGSEGLICRDNVRADIKVAFFVRVNNVAADVLKVAQSIGARRASDGQALVELFDAKFSEALKTVGKNFDFTELYTERERFKEEILAHLGTDLNGFVLDDAAIDYLEQTDIEALDPDNILDAEGIKKITDLTAREMVFANEIAREKEKTIKKQDVEAREAILELERQQADAEARQQREVLSVQAREHAEAEKVKEEERFKSERARISTEEELGVAEENKQRQVIVAEQSKLRTRAVEEERVKREQQLEMTERERLVELARIEKDKNLEVEKKKIQDVIRERVVVERAVVEEEERIEDTRAFAEADRAKQVQVTKATAQAEEDLIRTVKQAEAAKQAEQFEADQMLIDAEAKRASAEKEADAKKRLAEARTAEEAASGLAEAQVMDAKAGALQKYGTSEAEVIRSKGEAEAEASRLKFAAEAEGITQKAEAMKQLDGVGREHEEFKLNLDKAKQVELAAIDVQRAIAAEQAKVLGEAMKSAKIDIVGGDGEFFRNIVNAITTGKRVDRMIDNSATLDTVKRTFFNGEAGDGGADRFQSQVRQFIDRFGIDSEDVKNLSVAALMNRLMKQAGDDTTRDELSDLLRAVRTAGFGEKKVGDIGNGTR